MRAFALVSLLVAIAGSQNIDPSSVSPSMRASWCLNQRQSCPLLCLQVSEPASSATSLNKCDTTSLDWSCVCANGITPNVSQYSLTIPYFECTEYANQCVKNCGLGNNACSNTCRTAHPCGAQSPNRVNTSSSTSTASGSDSTAAATSLDSFGGAGSNGAAATSAAGSSGTKASAAMTAVNLGQAYGLTVVFGGIFAGFALLL